MNNDFPKRFVKHFFKLYLEYIESEIERINLYQNTPEYDYISSFGQSYYRIFFDIDDTKEASYKIQFRSDMTKELDTFFTALNSFEDKKFLKKLIIEQPKEEAYNGCYPYKLNLLLNNTTFEHLDTFKLEPFGYTPKSGIPSIDESGYGDSDERMGKKILDKMPNLKHLVLPNPPSKSFFERDFHPLIKLDIQNYIYREQHFLDNLAESKCFNNLEFFRFTESTKEDGYEVFGGDILTFEEYLSFFNNANLPKLREAELRSTQLSIEQINMR